MSKESRLRGKLIRRIYKKFLHYYELIEKATNKKSIEEARRYYPQRRFFKSIDNYEWETVRRMAKRKMGDIFFFINVLGDK